MKFITNFYKFIIIIILLCFLIMLYDYINIECSSKENNNIDETFDLIINTIINHKKIDLTIKENLEINDTTKVTTPNCCTIL